MAAAARRLRGRVPRPRRAIVGAGAQPRGPGPRGAPGGARPGGGHRSHHGRPGRDRLRQSAAGGGARRAGRHAPRARAIPCSGSGGRRPAALCAAIGLDPVYDPSNDDPRFVRNRIRHELLPLCARHRRARRRARAGPPGGDCWPPRPTCSTRWRPGSTRPTPPPWAGAPGPLARRATRRWLRGDGPYPPDLAAVERVLSVARGETRATDVAPGVRVRRARGRLSVAPVVPGAAAQVER